MELLDLRINFNGFLIVFVFFLSLSDMMRRITRVTEPSPMQADMCRRIKFPKPRNSVFL